MAENQTPDVSTESSGQVSMAQLSRMILDPWDHAMAAYERRALQIGVPVHLMIEKLLNHMCSIVAQVEPAGAREQLVKDLVSSFGPMCRKHYDARNTTPGGVIKPTGSI